MERELGKNGRMAAHIRKLFSDGGYRRECGLFICEGDKLLMDAARSGADIRTVIHTPGAVLPELGDGTELLYCSRELMSSLSPQKSPQGVMFICAMPPAALRVPDGFWLILDGVQDPGNVGTVLRSAEAFGAACVMLTEGCADPFLHKTVRASMGSVFRQRFCSLSREAVIGIIKERGVSLFAADGSAELTVNALPAGPCAVAVGSEGSGVSRQLRTAADGAVKIPMTGSCESLNAAVAASVILWEAWGRRYRRKEGSGLDG